MSVKTVDELIAAFERMKLRAARYRALLDDSNDPIFSFNRDGQYLYVNKVFGAGLDGHPSPDDIIGKTIWNFFSKEGADRRFAFVKKVFETGKPLNIEDMVPKDVDETFDRTAAKPVFDDAGNVDYLACIATNITERTRHEKELEKRTEELERALIQTKELKGIVPICVYCQQTRGDKGFWKNVEHSISTHTGAELGHGICPGCLPNVHKESGLKPPRKSYCLP